MPLKSNWHLTSMCQHHWKQRESDFFISEKIHLLNLPYCWLTNCILQYKHTAWLLELHRFKTERHGNCLANRFIIAVLSYFCPISEISLTLHRTNCFLLSFFAFFKWWWHQMGSKILSVSSCEFSRLECLWKRTTVCSQEPTEGGRVQQMAGKLIKKSHYFIHFFQVLLFLF